jgi:hypothetical protein
VVQTENEFQELTRTKSVGSFSFDVNVSGKFAKSIKMFRNKILGISLHQQQDIESEFGNSAHRLYPAGIPARGSQTVANGSMDNCIEHIKAGEDSCHMFQSVNISSYCIPCIQCNNLSFYRNLLLNVKFPAKL